ncbi:DUF1410 domain-containing protein [Mycoplasmopsis canis]|uniref:DUF1410 domain-containing protein n=1 Tax=Mycoplasmopsis canis TaxID=29555 RepID=UPI000B1FCCF4|nr:DUF1410 domain-containing protein [Mycoplasmopsis canis]
MSKELLTPIRKPSVIGDISTKANTIEKVINWNVNPGLANRTLRLEIQNEEGKIVELELKVDKSSNLSIDTSKLEYGHKWEIKKVIDIDKNNPNPVINLNDVDKKLKTIDLRDYSNNFGVNKNGDVIISSKISNVNDKTNIVAIFTDKNGNEYTVAGTLDNNGNAIFDTSLLPSEGEFVLNKIVNKDNNETLKSNNDLTDLEKTPIKKPEISISKDAKKELIHVSFHNSKTNKRVVLKFKDEDNKQYELHGVINSDGELSVSTVNLPTGHEYKLFAIHDLNNNPVANLKNIDPRSLLIDKLDHATSLSYDINGDKIISLNIGVNNANKEVSAVFIDSKNKKHVIYAISDNEGNLLLNTNHLHNNNEYNLLEIINDDEEIILPNYKIRNVARRTISKPEIESKVVSNLKEGSNLEIYLFNDQIENELKATFSNSKGELFVTTSVVDGNGNLLLNTANINIFPNGEKYTLISLTDLNDQKVINLNNSDPIFIDKRTNIDNNSNNYLDKYSYNKNGELELNIPLNNKTNNALVAVFVDENGNEHIINGEIDEKGNLVINTSSLPKPGEYKLEKIIDSKNPDSVIVSSQDLSDELKTPIKRPSVSGYFTEDQYKNKIIHLEFNPGLANRELEITFINEDGHTIKKNITTNNDSRISFNSISLESNRIWKIDSIKDKNSKNTNEVIDISELENNVRIIDKLNYSRTITVNRSGSLNLNIKLSKENSNKEVLVVFKDQNGSYTQYKATLDEKGKLVFNSNLLPNQGEFRLDRILDIYDKTIIKSWEELKESEKTLLRRPEANLYKTGSTQLDAKIVIEFHNARNNQKVKAIFRDLDDVEHEFYAAIGVNGILELKSSLLKEGGKYILSEIKDEWSNPIIELNRFDNDILTIDKSNYWDGSITRDLNGNRLVNLKMPEKYSNKNLVATFVNKYGQEFNINATSNENGDVSFNTKFLPIPSEFWLDKIKDTKDKVILKNNEIKISAKAKINKPAITHKILEDSKGAKDLEIKFPLDLVNQEIKAVLQDADGNKFEILATVNVNGNAVYDTSDNLKLPNNKKYTLIELLNKNNEKVVNLNEIEEIFINKTNKKLNGIAKTNADGSKQIEFNIPENLKTNNAVAVVKDINDNVFEIPTFLNEEGKLVVDTSSLDPNKIYTLDSVVDHNSNPETVIISNDDINNEVKRINNTKEKARKITFNNWNISDLSTTSASIEVSYSDINNLINPNINYVLKIRKQGENNVTISSKIKVDKENERFFFAFNSLEKNTNYIFDSIEPEFYDDSISVLNNLTNKEFKTPKYEVAIWSNTTLVNAAANALEINFEISDNESIKLAPNQQITGYYVKLEKDGSESEEQAFNITKENSRITLNNLSGNSIYVIKRFTIERSNEVLNLFKNDVTKYTQSLKTKPTPISITFEPENENINLISYEHALIKINYNDIDQKIEIGNPVTISFKKKDSENILTVEGRVIENNQIAFNLYNLDSASEYQILSLETAAKNPNSAYSYVFSDLDNSSFRTKNEIYDVINVSNLEDYTNDVLSRKIRVNLDKQGRLPDGKKAKIIFRSQKDGSEIESNAQIILHETRELVFTLDNLTRNRNYVFDRLVYGEDDNFTNRFLNRSDVDFSFTTNPGITKVLNWTFEDFKLSSNDLSIQINNPDNAFDENTVLELEYSKVNDETFSQKVTSNQLIKNGENFNVLFDEIPMELNQQYIVKNIKVKSKLNKPYRGINGTLDNTIFDLNNTPEDRHIFENKFKVLEISSSEVQDKRSNITIRFDENNNLFRNKSLRLKYNVNGTNEPKWTNIAIKNDNEEVTFLLDELDSNRQFTFENVYFVENADSTAIFDASEKGTVPLEKNIENIITLDPQLTKIIKYEIFNQTLERNSLKFEINNPDNVFEEGQKFELEYFKTSSPEQKLTKQTSLVIEDSAYKLIFSEIEMDLNEEYVVSGLSIIETPNKAQFKVNNSNKIYDLTVDQINSYKFINQFKIINYETNYDQNNTNASLSLSIQNNNNFIKNKTYRAKYIDNNGLELWTSVDYIDENGVISFELPNILKNRKYTLVDVYWVDGEKDRSNFDIQNAQILQKNSNIESLIEKNPGETQITNFIVSDPTLNSLSLEFTISNPDTILFNEDETKTIVLEYVKVSKTNNSEVLETFEIEAEAIINSNNEIFVKFADININLNDKYKVSKLRFKNKPNILYNYVNSNEENVIFQHNNNIQEYVFENKFIIDSVQSTLEDDFSVSVNVFISNNNNVLNNKKFKARFLDHNGENPLWTNLLSTSDGNLSFKINSVDKNRQYTFDKLYWINEHEDEGTVNENSTFVSKPQNIFSSFETPHGNTFIQSEPEVSNKTLSSNTIKFLINNPDNGINEGDLVTVEYFVVENNLSNDSTLINTIDNLPLSKEGDNYSFTIKNLEMEINKTYKIKTVKLNTKPRKLFRNVNNNGNNEIYSLNNSNNKEYAYKNTFILNSLSASKNANQNGLVLTTSFGFDNLFNDNKKYAVKYIDNTGSEVWSNIIDSIENPVFTIDNLNSNRTYTFDNVYWFEPNTTSETLTAATKHSIPKQNSITNVVEFEPGSTEIQSFVTRNKSLNDLDLIFNINDPDKVFEDGQEVILEYSKQSDSATGQTNELIRSRLNKIPNSDNFEVIFENINIDLNKQYIVQKLYLENKPAKAWKNINSSNDNSIYINTNNKYTFENKFILKSVQDSDTQPTETINKNIKIIVEADQEIINNKSIRLKYQDQNNKVIWSSIATIVSGNEIELQLSGLQRNRQYTFVDALFDSNNKTIDNFNINDLSNKIEKTPSLNHEFNIEKGETRLLSFSNSDYKLGSLDLKFVINDPDNAFSNNDILKIKYSNINDSNEVHEISANLIKENSDFKVEFDDLLLDINKTYIIEKVWLEAKPALALENINGNNVIFEKTTANLHQFGNKLAVKTLNIQNNSATSNSASIQAELEFNNHLQLNKKYKAKFTVNKSGIPSTIWTNTINGSSLNENNKSLTFELNNLPKNRSYTFEGIYWVDESASDDNFNDANNNKIQDLFSDIKEFSIEPGETKVEEFTTSDYKLSSMDLRFKLTNPDNAFNTSTRVILELSKKDQDQIIKSASTNLSYENGDYFAIFNDLELATNETYTIKSLRLETKPSSVLHNINYKNESQANNNQEIKIDSILNKDLINKFKLSQITHNLSSKNASLAINLSQNHELFNNKLFVAKYLDNSNNVKWSSIKAASIDISNDSATLSLDLVNLKSNRTYTFKDLYWIENSSVTEEELNRLTANNIVPKETQASDIIQVEPGETKVITFNKENVTLDKNDLVFTISNPDEIFDNSTILTLEYSVEGSQETLTKDSNLVAANGEYKVTFNDVATDINKLYTIKKLKVKSQINGTTHKINKREDNSIYDSSLDTNQSLTFKNDFLINRISQNVNETTSILSVTLNYSENSFVSNKKFRAKYTDNNNNVYLSEIVYINSSDVQFSFLNLVKNREYTLENIYYVDDSVNDNVFDTLNAKIVPIAESINKPKFETTVGQTQITNFIIGDSTTNSANLTVEINNPDKAFSNSDTLVMEFVKTSDTNQKTVVEASLQEINNNLFRASFNNLQINLNEQYYVTSFKLKNKPSLTKNNVNGNSDNSIYTFTNNKDYIFENNFRLESINSNLNSNNNSATVNVQINSNNNIATNKKFAIKYRSFNNLNSDNDETITSEIINFSNGGNLTFVLNNLKANRNYVFDQIIYGDTDNELSNNSAHNVNKGSNSNNIITPHKEISLSGFTKTNRESLDTIRLSFNINNPEDSLSNGDNLEITYAKVTDLNSEIKSIGQLTDESGKLKAIFEISRIDINEEYKVKKVRFISKPKKTYVNVNNNTDNVVYNYENNSTDEYKFINSFLINSLNSTLENNRLSINVNISSNQQILANKKFAIKYKSINDQGVENVNESLISNSIQTTNGSLQFSLENLIPNRKYEFVDLYYVSGNSNVDSNTTSAVPKQSHKDNKITAPGTTSLSNLIISETGQFNTRNISFNLNNPDNAFDTTTEVELTYVNEITNSETKLISSLQNASDSNFSASFNLRDIELNQNYKVKLIKIVQKPSKTYGQINSNNIIYDEISNATKYRFINNFEVTNISSELNSNNLNITASINVNNLIFNSKKVAIRYKSVNDRGNDNLETVISNSVVLKNGENTFTISNLKSNRRYVFDQVIFTNSNQEPSLSTNTFVPKQSTTNSVDIDPKETIANNYQVISTGKLDTTSISFDINNPDEALNEGDSLVVVYAKKESLETELNATGTLISKNNNYSVLFNLNNIELNKDYQIKYVKLVNKPEKTLFNVNKKENNTIYDYLQNTSVKHEFKNSFIINQLNSSLTFPTMTINANINASNNILNGKKFAVKYRTVNESGNPTGEEVISNSSTAAANGDLNFVINNLNSNRKYEFVSLLYTEDGSNVNLSESKSVINDNITDSQITNPGQTAVSNYEVIPTGELNSTRISFVINNPDNALSLDSRLRLTFVESNNDSASNVVEANLTQFEDKFKVTFDINNITLNKEYKVKLIELINQPSVLYKGINANNIIFSNSNDEYKFENKFKLLAITSSLVKNTLSIQASFDISNNIQNNKKIAIRYKSLNNENIDNNENVISNSITASNGTLNFTIDNLKNNRKYVFDQILYDQNDVSINESKIIDKGSQSNEQITAPANTEVSNYNVIPTGELNSTRLSFTINNPDDSFNNDTEVVLTYYRINEESRLFTSNAHITNDSNELKLFFDISNVQLNNEYKVKEIRILNKPSVTFANVNNHNNNVVYDVANDTTIGFKFENKLNIAALDSSLSGSNLTINAMLNSSNNILEGKKFIVKYRSLNNANTENESESVVSVPINANNNSLEFSLQNLNKNRKYEFVGIWYANQNDLLDTANSLTVSNTLNLTNSVDVAQGETVESEFRQININSLSKVKISFEINNPDNAFDTTTNVTMGYFKKGAEANVLTKNVNLIQQNSKYEAIFELDNIELNADYQVKYLKVTTKPNKTLYNINKNDQNEIFNIEKTPNKVYTFKNSFILSALNANYINDNLNVEAFITSNNDNLLNKKFAIRYKSVDNNETDNNENIISPAQTTADGRLLFNLTGFNKNRKYVFDGILYSNDSNTLTTDNKVALTNTISSQNNFFIIEPGKTVESNFEKINNASLNSARVSFDINNPDNALRANDVIIITYAKSNDLANEVDVETILQTKENGFIAIFDINNIELNQEYKIKTIKLKNKPEKTYYGINKVSNNVIYDYNVLDKQYVFKNEFILENFTPSFENNNTFRINAKIRANNNLLSGKKFALKYKSLNQNSEENIDEKIISLSIEASQDGVLNWTIPNLNSNRKYELLGLFYSNDNNDITIDSINSVDLNGTTHSQITAPGLVNESNFLVLDTSNFNTRTLSFEINNPDNAFDTNNQIKLTYIDLETNTNKTITTNLTKLSDNKFSASFAVNDLVLNKKYKITKLELVEKPNKTFTLINSNNIIYDYTSQDKLYEFENKFKVTSLTSELNNQNLSVRINFDLNNSLMNNKKVAVIYRSENNFGSNNDESIISNSLQLTNGELSFEINNLKKNRKYVFEKVVFSDNAQDLNLNNNQIIEAQGIADFHVTDNGNSEVSNYTIVHNESLDSINISFDVSDPDEAYKVGDELILEYSKTNETSLTKNVSGRLTRTSDKFNVSFNINNLDINTEYKVLSIKFKNKPNKTFNNINLNNNNEVYNHTTNSSTPYTFENKLIMKSINSNIEGNNLVVNVTLDATREILNNKQFAIKYKSLNNNGDENVDEIKLSNSITTADGSLRFTISNLIPNRKYEFFNIYFNNEEVTNSETKIVNKNNLTDNKITSFGNVEATNFTIINNNSLSTKTIFFDINDSDQAFDQSTEVQLIYAKLNDLNTKYTTKTTISKQENRFKATFTIDNIDLNIEYKVLEVKIVNKPNKTYTLTNGNGTIYNSEASPTKNDTFINLLRLNSISSELNDQRLTISTNFEVNNNIHNGKKVALIYKSINSQGSENTDEEVISDAKDLSNGDITFVINNLKKNRKYVFDRIVYSENGNNPTLTETKTISRNNKNNEKEVPHGSTTASSFKIIPNGTLDSTSFSFVISDPDEAINVGDQVEVTYASTNDLGVELKATSLINSDSNGLSVQFNVNNIALNTKYKILKIKLVSKPAKTLKNINDNNENIIYNSTTNVSEEYKFENKFKLTNVTSQLNDRTLNISANIEATNNILNSRKFAIKYKSLNDQNIENVDEVIISEAVNGTQNGQLSFVINNLKPNRKYEFVDVLFANIADNITNETSDVVNKAQITNNVTTNNANTVASDYRNFNSTNELNKKVLEFSINDADSSFENGMTLQLKYSKMDNSNEISVSSQLINNSGTWKVQFEAINLELNTEYKVREIKFVTKPRKTLNKVNNNENNIVYSDSENNQAYTFKNELILTNLTSSYNQNLVATATIQSNPELLNNKKFIIVYKSYNGDGQDNNEDIISSVQTASSNGNITFVLSGLKKNRKYKFDKIYYADNTDPNTNSTELIKSTSSINTNNEFIVGQGNTVVESYQKQDNGTLDSVRLSFSLNNPDELLDNNTQVEIVYFATNNSSNELKQTVTLSQSGSNFNAIFNLSNITLNQEYKVKSLKLVNKPSKAYYDINNNNNIIYSSDAQGAKSYTFKNDFVLSSIHSALESNNNINVTANINANNNILNGKYFAVKFKSYNNNRNENAGEEIISNAIVSQNGSLTWTLTNTRPNRVYKFDQIIYKNSDSITNSDTTFVAKNSLTSEITTTNSAINASNFRKISSSNFDQQTVAIDINDGDFAFDSITRVEMVYTKINDSAEITAQTSLISQGTSFRAEFSLNGLEPNKEYKVKIIRLLQKPNKTATNINGNNIIYSSENNSNEFKFMNEFKLNSLSSELQSNSTNLTVTATYEDSDNYANGKEFRIKYIDQNNEIKISDPGNLDTNAKRIAFNISLIKNREYTFSGIYYDDVNASNESNKLMNLLNIEDTKITSIGNTNAIVESAPVSAIAQEIATIKVEIISEDQVLEEGQQVQMTLGEKENRNTSNDKIITQGITVENGKYYASFSFSGLIHDTEYKVYDLKFVSNPRKAKNNINNSSTFIINLPNEEIKFKSSIEPAIENNSVITLANSNAKDETLRSKDIIEASYEVLGTWTNVIIPEELIDNDYENKGFVMTYTGAATLRNNENATHVITATNINYNRQSKVINFTLKGLKAGYNYNLTSFIFKQKRNTTATSDQKVDKIMNINSVLKSNHIAKGYGWEYLIFKPNYSYWPMNNEALRNNTVWLGFDKGFEANDFLRLFDYIKFRSPIGTHDYVQNSSGVNVSFADKWTETLKQVIRGAQTYVMRQGNRKPLQDRMWSIQLGRKWEDTSTRFIDRMEQNFTSRNHSLAINHFYKPQLGALDPRPGNPEYGLSNGVIESRQWKFISNTAYERAIDNILAHVTKFVIRDESQKDAEDNTKQYPNNPSSPIVPNDRKFSYNDGNPLINIR